MTENNQKIAKLFLEIAAALDIRGENRFRIITYRNVAGILLEMHDDVADLSKVGTLSSVKGIGSSSVYKIEEYLKSGKIKALDDLMNKVSITMLPMLDIPGVGPKTVAKFAELEIKSIEALTEGLSDPDTRSKIEKSLGSKTTAKIQEGLKFQSTTNNRMRIDTAVSIATRVVNYMRESGLCIQVQSAGSVRRGKDTIGDIDIISSADPANHQKVVDHFVKAPWVGTILNQGSTKGAIMTVDGAQIDLRVVNDESYGAALAYFTGSKDHNITMRNKAIAQGKTLNEYGLWDPTEGYIAGKTEESIYAALGVPFTHPHIREGSELIKFPPELIALETIKGDLHIHTRASDGNLTVAQIADIAKSKGYSYIAICDHSKSQTQAGGLKEDAIDAYIADIHKVRDESGLFILAGIEVDIMKDGTLDYDDKTLSKFDFVVAAAHSHLTLKGDEATQRMVKAIENPHVHCIAHLTGRIIKQRPGMELDINKVVEAAVKHNTLLEINANPSRLDLCDNHVKAAISGGAKIVINTDSHRREDFDLMKYGVVVARRGMAKPHDVFNAHSLGEVVRLLENHHV